MRCALLSVELHPRAGSCTMHTCVPTYATSGQVSTADICSHREKGQSFSVQMNENTRLDTSGTIECTNEFPHRTLLVVLRVQSQPLGL